ncbi:NAD(P)H-dependent oxidoreductase [Microbulbifer sp. SSSA005]|uniref:NAD(P)H-dependent oxidoreductase n=1 Tax=Microbulbifer sp. SSSA005 TaxID=3243378 RepID=UPI00403A6337
MKNILLLNGNPKKNSFVKQLSDVYESEAKKQANVRRYNLSEMDFNSNLEFGYDDYQVLEDCLYEFQEALKWAQHIVVMSPIWWGGLPGKLKGLIDRSFLPGITFKFESGSAEPIQLLKGKTSRIILTMDAPTEYLEEQAKSVLEQLDRFTLQYCGFSKAEVSLFGSMIMSDKNQQDSWLKTVKALGASCI